MDKPFLFALSKLLILSAASLFGSCALVLHHSPGTLYPSSDAALSPTQIQLRDQMQHDVEKLSVDIGPRHGGSSLAELLEAEKWLIASLSADGIETRRDVVDLGNLEVANVEASFPGTALVNEIIVVGAHFDTVPHSPGANDNASGVALLLATARALRDVPLDRTVRVVFFVNEENPFSGGIQMGSKLYAERCRKKNENIVAMICVDSVGYFSNEPGSQEQSFWVSLLAGLPKTGNFVLWLSNRENQELLDQLVSTFQQQSHFPSLGIATDLKGAARSDHASFWWQDYPAFLLTDTSEGRDPHYHKPTDTIDNLNFDEMARLAEGFIDFVVVLARTDDGLSE
jgi:hypothetical protein